LEDGKIWRFSWEDHGNITGILWEGFHGKFFGEIFMVRSWEYHGKVFMGTIWNRMGIWENASNSMVDGIQW
jgi:hypothetical protein